MADQKSDQIKIQPGSTTIIKKGKLEKKGEGFLGGFSWKERYFVLKSDGYFAYYEDANCTKFKNKIDLRNVFKVERCDSKNLYLHTKDRKWHLYSKNKTDLDEWDKLLSQLSQKNDSLSFVILKTNCLAKAIKDSGFIGDGLFIKINGIVFVETNLTFCSFIYPSSKQNISFNKQTQLDLINNINAASFKIKIPSVNKSYDIKVHKKSLQKNSVLPSTLKKRTDVVTDIKYNFSDEKNQYNQLFANDIYVNTQLLCNYTINSEYTMDLIGSKSKILFITTDDRKIVANINIICDFEIKPKYQILRKNDPNTHNQWQICCNTILSAAMEQKIRSFVRLNKDLYINQGKGNSVHLLPEYMRSKLPWKECHQHRIPQEILNKKFLCHIQLFIVNKYGETLNKMIYLMGEITFDREEHIHREEYMDTLRVGQNGKIIHSDYTLRQLFGFEQGTFDATMNACGRNVVKQCHYLQFDNRVKVVVTPIHNNPQLLKEAKVYAKIKETRYYYVLKDHYSEYDQSDQLPDSLPVCVIL